jgi:WD40 repeat protein
MRAVFKVFWHALLTMRATLRVYLLLVMVQWSFCETETGGVQCFVCVSDTFAACGGDGFLKLCHPTELKIYRTFNCTGEITCLTTTSTGDIVSGNGTGHVCAWNVYSPLPCWSRHTHARVKAITSRGDWVITDVFTTIRAHSIATVQCIDFHGHEGVVTSLAFLTDVSFASSARDSTVRIWNLENRTMTHCYNEHYSWVTSLCVFPNGDFASGSCDGTVRIWGPGGCTQVLRASKKQVRGIAVVQSHLVTCTNDQTLFWE